MNSLAGIDMGRILLNLSNELFKQLDDLEVQRNLLVRSYYGKR